ncbi:ATP-binding protein [Streptomyces nojiriensis]|uniref:ATP-binding protein n=1 Tax=Streptomyces nojiriensis TaxID=66374 RepID=UPI0036639BB7
MKVTVTSTVWWQRFSSTRRGARLARHLALIQLHGWGIPLDSERSQTAALVIAELAANAVTHGRIPGRDFELRLELTDGTLRVAVADARGEGRPRVRQSTDGVGGHGLRLIEALSVKWGVEDRPTGKTVWAELAARVPM